MLGLAQHPALLRCLLPWVGAVVGSILRDAIGCGMISEAWAQWLPPLLLQDLLDDELQMAGLCLSRRAASSAAANTYQRCCCRCQCLRLIYCCHGLLFNAVLCSVPCARMLCAGVPSLLVPSAVLLLPAGVMRAGLRAAAPRQTRTREAAAAQTAATKRAASVTRHVLAGCWLLHLGSADAAARVGAAPHNWGICQAQHGWFPQNPWSLEWDVSNLPAAPPCRPPWTWIGMRWGRPRT